MSTNITETNFVATDFVASQSRYQNNKVIFYSENNFITFPIYKKSGEFTTPSDVFTVIKEGEEFRPDLTSQRAFGFPDLWWRIMEVNNIFDIFNFVAGRTIRIPGNLF